jgi:HNH endonuclease
MKSKPDAKTVRNILHYNPGGKNEWFFFYEDYPIDDSYSRVVDDHLQIKIDGEFYPAEELAWLIMTGAWPENAVLHHDGQTLNNAWNNLYGNEA